MKQVYLSKSCQKCNSIGNVNNLLCSCPRNASIASKHRNAICKDCRILVEANTICLVNRHCNAVKTRILKHFEAQLKTKLLFFQNEQIKSIDKMFEQVNFQ